MVAPWLTVARIAKTQGRRGEVAAEILTDFPERLLERDRVWLWNREGDPQPARVENVWPHKHYLVFKLAGCDSINEAEKLLGREIQIPRAEAAPLAEREFFHDQLVGCRVVEQATGRELGRVRELLTTAGTDLLAIETPERRELLIPFAEEFCPRIDAEEKLIEVTLPEELRELNR